MGNKLSDFFPERPAWVEKQQRLDNLISFASSAIDIQKSQGGETFRSPSFGIDNLAYLWSKQYTQNRAQMLNDLFAIASTVAEIRAPVMHIRNEVFRRGIEWHAKFSKKCKDCGQEYSDEVEKCASCGSTNLRAPEPSQKDRLKPFISNSNVFGNSLIEISKQLEWDANVVDEMYLYVAKEFIATGNGDEVRSKPLEIRRLNPAYIEMDLNSQGLPKANHFVCLIHREQVKKAGATKDGKREDMVCPTCNRPLVPIMWIYYYRGAKKYLLESEICRASKFEINELGGFSPILTIFEKALTLIGMDKMAFKYFFERKLPASILMVWTDDVEGLRREREGMLQQLAKNPDYVPMMGVSSKQGARGRAELLRLFHTFAEMDYMPLKNEIRERIASLWGVTPIWQTAVESVGGMSSQTAQLVVTSRVVESDQSIFNDKMYPFLCEAFGIDDWEIRLKVPEEKAESTRIQFGQQRIAAANMLHMMGFDVKLKPGVKSIDDVDFIVSGEALDMKQQMGMGGGAPPATGGEGGNPSPDGGQPPAGQGGAPPADIDDRGEEAGGKFPGFKLGNAAFEIKPWIPQILEKGLMVKALNDVKIPAEGSMVQLIFTNSDDQLYEALFNVKGSLLGINRLHPAKPGMHEHEGYPTPHPTSLPHDTMTMRNRREDMSLAQDRDEEAEDGYT
jgi:predicted Zn-ribbon and HTH transcriptional regulator